MIPDPNLVEVVRELTQQINHSMLSVCFWLFAITVAIWLNSRG
jgi:hypothetical protein